MTFRSRARGALAAGVLLAPLLPFGGTAFAVPPDPPPVQSIEQFCAGVPTTPNPFTDIAGNTHERAIECAAAAEIARGGPEELPDTQYGPFRAVRRDQMAAFIARMMDKADELDCDGSIRALPAFDNNDGFRDVDASNTHHRSITRLEDAGIVLGGPEELPDDSYGPARNVRRDQMASFINRAVRFMTGAAHSTNEDYFTDDEASLHENNINGIASVGITNGFTGDTYGPATNVPRDQMASFIVRALADLEERQKVNRLNEDCPENPFEQQDITVTPDDEAEIEVPGGADSTALATRSYTATGLVPGAEYRITLVDEDFATRGAPASQAPGGVQFTATAVAGTSEGFAVNTGSPEAVIVSVNGDTTPSNNTGPGTAPTAVTNSAVGIADANGRIVFVVGSNEEELRFFPVVYVNGGGDGSQESEEGNQHPRLETDEDGFAVEQFDAGGTVEVVNDNP